MPSSFPTESSGLGRKRKLADFDIEPLCAQFLNVLREEKIFAAIEQTEWNKMEKVLQESCNVPDLSKPFTEAKSYYRSLFEPKSSWIFLREDISPPAMPHPEEKGRQREPGKREAPPSDPYQEAAAKLKSNPLWKGVKAHIVMKNDASCRTAIDLVVLTAIDLAQSMISQNQELDRTLNDRFSIQGPKRRVADSGQAIAAWVVLQHEVEIPNQRLRPELSVHGILDYLLCVMPTSRVQMHIPQPRFLDSELYNDRAPHIGECMTGIAEAKSISTMQTGKASVQAAVQGAALCVMTNRASFVNTVTTGTHWKFFVVTKASSESHPAPVPDSPTRSTLQPAPDPPRRSSRSTRAPATRQPSTATRRRATSGKAAGPEASGSKTAKTQTVAKPFKASETRVLDVFRDLHIILRLLTVAILSSADDFERIAETAAA